MEDAREERLTSGHPAEQLRTQAWLSRYTCRGPSYVNASAAEKCPIFRRPPAGHGSFAAEFPLLPPGSRRAHGHCRYMYLYQLN